VRFPASLDKCREARKLAPAKRQRIQQRLPRLRIPETVDQRIAAARRHRSLGRPHLLAVRLVLGARAEAEQKVLETNLSLIRNRTLAEVDAAFRAYESAREQVRAYEIGLLKQADESREIQLGAYHEGVTELIALIDAQKTRTEVRANYSRAIFDYYLSIFQLELATGTDIKR
jgi:hypothetical protein